MSEKTIDISIEDKILLIKDLSARKPYGVHIEHKSGISGTLHNMTTYRLYDGDDVKDIYCVIDFFGDDDYISVEYFKPYLFPLSSMTEEQEEELKNIYYSFNGMFQYTERIFDRIPFGKMKYFPYQIEEFFNKNNFDYRGLIKKGLAIDATGLNIY